MQELLAEGGTLGSSRCVAAFRGVVCVGFSTGVVAVLMPRGLSTEGHPSKYGSCVRALSNPSNMKCCNAQLDSNKTGVFPFIHCLLCYSAIG